jgi:hypothetical protein
MIGAAMGVCVGNLAPLPIALWLRHKRPLITHDWTRMGGLVATTTVALATIWAVEVWVEAPAVRVTAKLAVVALGVTTMLRIGHFRWGDLGRALFGKREGSSATPPLAPADD